MKSVWFAVVSFKGSEIDRNFSFGKLERTISLQQEQVLIQRHQYGPSKMRLENRPFSTFYETHNPGLSRTLTNTIQQTLELLFKQEQNFEKMPYELTQAAERKRQRQRLRYR